MIHSQRCFKGQVFKPESLALYFTEGELSSHYCRFHVHRCRAKWFVQDAVTGYNIDVPPSLCVHGIFTGLFGIRPSFDQSRCFPRCFVRWLGLTTDDLFFLDFQGVIRIGHPMIISFELVGWQPKLLRICLL